MMSYLSIICKHPTLKIVKLNDINSLMIVKGLQVTTENVFTPVFSVNRQESKMIY
jgi:hypothetical protein